MDKTQEKLEKLIQAYTPEFKYEKGSKDPGSVLTTLCGDMIADSSDRFGRVIPRSRLQYLNLFDAMVDEPVSAARGYEQFIPVAGYEDMIIIPRGTQVESENADGPIIFETEHDLTVTDTRPEIVVVSDGDMDRLVENRFDNGKMKPFYAFDVRGENLSRHILYLGFDNLLGDLEGLSLRLEVKSAGEDQDDILEKLTSKSAKWFIVDPEKGEIPFASFAAVNGKIALELPDYAPVKSEIGQHEAYYIGVGFNGELPKMFIQGMEISLSKEDVVPAEKFAQSIAQSEGGFLAFGKPLGLYNEFSFDDREVLSRKGANISISFDLSYRIHEEIIEIPEIDTEYKAIMKKPRKSLAVASSEIHADFVLWEYLSTTGWKRLLKDDNASTVFNGVREGEIRLDFICPEDMADYEIGSTGRIRARLITAENIYKIPAVYHCPFITDLKLSYSYDDMHEKADIAFACNNFDMKDVTDNLNSTDSFIPFYKTEKNERTMYIGFSGHISGTPFGLYFDIENYSDKPMDYTVEYFGKDGFENVKLIDYTDGMCGSGCILLVIPTDAVRTEMYGYEGYFIRLINKNRDLKDYELPLIKAIYPNMARIVNRNTVSEEFYIDSVDEQTELKLSTGNLLKAEVYVHEEGDKGWVRWEKADSLYAGGRTYMLDMATGELNFRKNCFALFPISEDGPHIRVVHSNYMGDDANLPAGAINTIGVSIRFLSEVTNPFPTYGGYESYTPESQMNYVSGLLRTRKRAVTEKDFYDVISGSVHGVRKVKCMNHVGVLGEAAPEQVTVSVLIEDYEKGAHVFSEIKRQIRETLLAESSLLATGRTLNLIQPHFVKVSVRVWLEKEELDHAYDIQLRAMNLIKEFIDPLSGGQCKKGWEIGEFPRTSQIVAALRNGIPGCNINKILMTALVDGHEVPVDDYFAVNMKNPFLMAVNGEHVVYIEVN